MPTNEAAFNMALVGLLECLNQFCKYISELFKFVEDKYITHPRYQYF